MQDILYEKKGHTGVITFHKPADLNALSIDFIEQINEALDSVCRDDDIHVLIMTGSGKAFIAGADIREMYEKDETAIMEWSAYGSGLNLRLASMKIPVIAAINGFALGGGLELAMACDVRIASENAVLGLPEVSLGVICAAGGTQRLPRLVGQGIAKELIFTGKKIDAAEALRIGLVNHVVSRDALMETALSLAEQIQKNGQLAVQAAKKAINAADSTKIEDGCLYERQIFSRLFSTEDQKIGMGGFLRKEKKIQFQNR